MTLSSHFNLNATKQQKTIKTEDDIRTGVRKDSYGNTKFVRGGKIQRIVWADGSRDTHGAEMKQGKLRELAAAENERRREQARMSKALSPRAH